MKQATGDRKQGISDETKLGMIARAAGVTAVQRIV
jgi:hypothetical protein